MIFPIAVALSVCGLFVGPSLGALAHRRRNVAVAVDAATLALVLGAVALRLLPHLVAEAGAAAIVGFAAGYAGIAFADARAHRRSAELGIAIVLPTLVVHSFIDGAALGVALGEHAGSGGAVLAAALLAHRVPEGMFVASVMKRARRAIAAMAASTIAGSLIGRELLAHAPDALLHSIVAVGLGVMLRLVVHRHDHHHQADHGGGTKQPARPWIGGVTFLVCFAAIAAIPSPPHVFGAAQPNELSAVAWLAAGPLLAWIAVDLARTSLRRRAR